MKIRKEITVLLAIITAVFIGMILLASQGYSPSQSYAGILKYSLSTSVGRANTINRFVFLLISGASAALALGSGVSNLGQFGQILMGAMASTLVGLYIDSSYDYSWCSGRSCMGRCCRTGEKAVWHE